MKNLLNVGVISCSGMEQNHIIAMKNNSCVRLASVCNIELEKARNVAQEFGVQSYYRDYHDLPTRPDMLPGFRPYLG